ncbi:MAG: hypothetical protein WCK08_20640 [Betaproteobacteria bacterium]
MKRIEPACTQMIGRLSLVGLLALATAPFQAQACDSAPGCALHGAAAAYSPALATRVSLYNLHSHYADQRNQRGQAGPGTLSLASLQRQSSNDQGGWHTSVYPSGPVKPGPGLGQIAALEKAY